MTTIYVLYENTHDRAMEPVCWHADRHTLEMEAERREWDYYRAQKAREIELKHEARSVALSPDERAYRRFDVQEIRHFNPEALE